MNAWKNAGFFQEAQELEQWTDANGRNWGWDGWVRGTYPQLVPTIWSLTTDPRDVALGPVQQAYVAAAAERTGRSWQETLAELVPSDAGTPEQPAQPCKRPGKRPGESNSDYLRRIGLLGSFRSGHTDLSTNPIHMEGFGE